MHTCSGSRGGASTELPHPALPGLPCRVAPARVHLSETLVSKDLLFELINPLWLGMPYLQQKHWEMCWDPVLWHRAHPSLLPALASAQVLRANG